MSCPDETRLGCGLNPYPFTRTSLEPLPWNRAVSSYISIDGEDLVSEICFYVRAEDGDLLQFKHQFEYDADGNVIQMDVI